MTTATHENELTQHHYDLLAKARQFAETGDIEGWEDQMFDATSNYISSTRDPLEAFDGSAWREAEGREDFKIDGHSCIHWERVQARKGDQRESLTVINLGDICLAYQV